MTEHISVMLNEVLEALRPWENISVVVDATLGLGGHSGQILKHCGHCSLIGFEQDPAARKIATENLVAYEGRYAIEADNFKNIGKLAERDEWNGADAVLFDLGVSNLQLTDSERGFSFQENGPLDMRMDSGDCCNSTLTAEEILSEWSIKDLTRIFREYGEDPFAYQIAKGIVRNRENGGVLRTTNDLVALIRRILPEPVQRKMGGHPARRIFQALRIAVNNELDVLDKALDGAEKIAAPGGRIIVISYHSLEDRMVKKRFRSWREQEIGAPNPRKAMLPTEEEIEKNRKSRSAKMRIFIKNRTEEE